MIAGNDFIKSLKCRVGMPTEFVLYAKPAMQNKKLHNSLDDSGQLVIY